MILHIIGHKAANIIDALSATTLIGGIVTGHTIAIIFGGIASIVAILNHVDQILERRRNRKKQNP